MVTTFKVEDNDKHEPVLNYYPMPIDEPVLCHLFEVHIFNPENNSWFGPQYCLSPDADGAVHQCCPFNVGDAVYDQSVDGSYAVQKPMKIRGWGSTTF